MTKTILTSKEAIEKGYISKNFKEGQKMYYKVGERNTCKCSKCGKVLKGILHVVISDHKQNKGVSLCNECENHNTITTCMQAHSDSISTMRAKSVKPFILEVSTKNENLQRAISFHGFMHTVEKGFYDRMYSDMLYTRESASSVVKKALAENATVRINGEVVKTYNEYMELTKA